MRLTNIPVLPFIIAYILGGILERTARQAFASTGADPYFLFQPYCHNIHDNGGGNYNYVLSWASKMTRPNILFICRPQHRADLSRH